MFDSSLDFNRISDALSSTIKALKNEQQPEAANGMKELLQAQEELQQAWSYTLSKANNK